MIYHAVIGESRANNIVFDYLTPYLLYVRVWIARIKYKNSRAWEINVWKNY